MQPSPASVTRLLQEWSDGRREAFDELFPLVYDELRRLAARHLRRERTPQTLQATALVNEAYLRLVQQAGIRCDSRAHFFGIAARVMRCLLVDRARARKTAKRGDGDVSIVLDAELEGVTLPPGLDMLALDEALNRLADTDARQSQLVELRFFGGLTIDEVATVLGISPATVSREWTMARAWLYAQLKGDDGRAPVGRA
ncbi:MAG: sigma-70 family RNA polymerase sigma factor [Bacteroidales bacterium]